MTSFKKMWSQIEFSSLFFDTLFGLILFFSLDSFLEIQDPTHFILYMFMTIVVAHWWLIFKSAEDIFQSEAANSALNIVFGLAYILFLEFAILFSKSFDYRTAVMFVIATILADLAWSLVWNYVGEWRTRDSKRIVLMEKELDKTIRIDAVFALLLAIPVIFSGLLTPAWFVFLFIVVYSGFIFFTFREDIVDIAAF